VNTNLLQLFIKFSHRLLSVCQLAFQLLHRFLLLLNCLLQVGQLLVVDLRTSAARPVACLLKVDLKGDVPFKPLLGQTGQLYFNKGNSSNKHC
jgi:hypothetical protein